MILTSENPFQNEKSSAKTLPALNRNPRDFAKDLAPTRAENENPSIQT